MRTEEEEAGAEVASFFYSVIPLSGKSYQRELSLASPARNSSTTGIY